MDKLVQVFSYHDAQVRTANLFGQPAFCAKDVCDILEIQNGRDAVGRLDEDEKGVVLTDTLGGGQPMTYVTEAGLYALILSSRKPEAREFRRWVTHEVLPQIRKTGSYSIQPALPSHLETAKALVAALEQIEADKDKVLFYDSVAEARGLHDMGATAKLLGWGRNKLFARLRDMHILASDNEPMQQYIKQGHFIVRERLVPMGKAGEVVKAQTFVTPKGLEWLHKVAPAPQKHGFPGLMEHGETAGGAR